jgi:hypothetical protein
MFILDFYSTNSKVEKFSKIATFLFPIFFISVLVFNKIIFGPGNISYFMFLAEDGPVEYATTVFFFLSFLFSTIIGLKFIKVKKNFFALLYFLLSASFFIAGFEEISWGQRIFQIETPENFSENLQNEITFHNFPKLHNLVIIGYFLVSLIGSFSWIIFSKTNKLKSFKKFFIPQHFLMSYFVPIFLFVGMLAIRSFGPTSSDGFWFYMFHWRDMEALEFLLAAGIFLFFLFTILNFKKDSQVSQKNLKTFLQ